MSIQTHSKLNQLQRLLPEGLPVDSNWLQKQGYSRQLIAKYLHNGWLTSPIRGVYLRESKLIDQQNWEPVVVSLQRLLELPFTVGGRTAIELHGLAHYLPMTTSGEVHLYGAVTPPSWLTKLPLKRKFSIHKTSLFKSNGARPGDDKDRFKASFMDYRWGNTDWLLNVSTPERAILELLDELPKHETFHQADVLMEGLSNLRPKYLNVLLRDCRSIKTKRLFLCFSQRHNHAWFKAIEVEKIDIGSGKRMLVPGGKLDSKYLITVPEEFSNDR